VFWRAFLLVLVLIAGLPPTAAAVEYRLRVVNLPENAFGFYLPPKVADGAPLSRLEAALDRGEVSPGVLLYGQVIQPVSRDLAKSFQAVVPLAEVEETDGKGSWVELKWEGESGKRSVFLVEPRRVIFPEVFHVALRGRNGALHYWRPYGAAISGPRSPVVGVPLNLIHSWEGREGLWPGLLSRYLEPSEGIGAVVGVNLNPLVPDHVFVIIEQGAEPATYKIVLGWRQRGPEQSPLRGNFRDR